MKLFRNFLLLLLAAPALAFAQVSFPINPAQNYKTHFIIMT